MKMNNLFDFSFDYENIADVQAHSAAQSAALWATVVDLPFLNAEI